MLVIDPHNVAIAQRLLDGQQAPSIPNGLVVRGDPSVNTGCARLTGPPESWASLQCDAWDWHIDPQSFEFADATTEVCDGKPSFVEAGTITSDYYCPWSAQVIAIEPANP